MPKQTEKLSDVQLRAWVKQGAPIVGKSDGAGLVFTLTKGGCAAFVLRYQFGGRGREITLGKYPDLTLTAARKWASELRVRITKGEDVAASKQTDKQKSKHDVRTVSDLCTFYMDQVVLPGPGRKGFKNPQIPQSRFDNHVIPVIGKMELAKVTQADIRRTFIHGLNREERMPDGSTRKFQTPTIANDVLQLLKQSFEYACIEGFVEVNPAYRFTPKHAGGREYSRTRWLTEDEIKRLFKAMRATPNLGRANELAVKLLLALACRKTELLFAKWDEFDEDGAVWHLSGGRTKTGASIDIPLAPLALSWLRELKELARKSEYLFPQRRHDRDSRQETISQDTLNKAVDRVEHGIPSFTLHDLRRTARTHMSRMGFADAVLEKALNHAAPKILATYNQNDYLAERRVALNAWADRIASFDPDDTPNANVVPIRAAA